MVLAFGADTKCRGGFVAGTCLFRLPRNVVAATAAARQCGLEFASIGNAIPLFLQHFAKVSSLLRLKGANAFYDGTMKQLTVVDDRHVRRSIGRIVVAVATATSNRVNVPPPVRTCRMSNRLNLPGQSVRVGNVSTQLGVYHRNGSKSCFRIKTFAGG